MEVKADRDNCPRMGSAIEDVRNDAVRTAGSRIQVPSQTSIREDRLVSLADPRIVSSGARDRPRADHARVEQTIVDHTGRSFPLGASVIGEGVNFSVFSRQAGADRAIAV
jgi:hypothetical protein